MVNIFSDVRRPAVRYFGSKWRLASKIVPLLSFPHEVYVEPFGGSACVLIRKRPSKYEIYNDLEKSVVNFFTVLRDNTEELACRISLTPWSRFESKRCAKYMYHKDVVEWARRFYVASWQQMDPGRASSGWLIYYSKLCALWPSMDNLLLVANRICSVLIECRDALDIIRKYDSYDTLYYVDPPYMYGHGYKIGMSIDRHVDLATLLHDIKGMCIISGRSGNIYDDMYADFDRITYSAVNIRNAQYEECIWLNY